MTARLLFEGIAFSVCAVGLFVGLPLWYLYKIWLPWTADIIDEAVHGKWVWEHDSGGDVIE